MYNKWLSNYERILLNSDALFNAFCFRKEALENTDLMQKLYISLYINC